ncbi:MAG TPA: extracellular solute-binding protein [Actinomycetota bacterium]
MRRLVVATAVLTFVAAACTAGGGDEPAPTVDTAASNEPVTVTLTGEWTSKRECDEWQNSFKENFEAEYDWITVDAKCGVTEEKQIAAINAGNPPDAFLSFGVDNVGRFCDSGAWVDLNPYIDGPDGVDRSVFVDAALTYTSFEGTQCSLPFLTDTYGLYYNLDLFKAAGLTDPPKTTDELTEDAKKLTEFNPDGSIKVAGFVPVTDYYCCSSNLVNMSHMFGASYLDEGGSPAFASDPAWAEMLQWQHDFIAEVYGEGDFQTGAEKLRKFVAGAGNEWGNPQDFQQGRVAMMIDGEWRTAFMTDFAPEVNYATAPLPTSPSRTDLYGSATAGGTIVGIPKGAEHPAEAWLLVKYLATNTDTLVYMANWVGNVPTTHEAIDSPDLDLPEQFGVFMEAFAHPDSAWRPTTVLGEELEQYLGNFTSDWQTGDATDLEKGLQDATEQTQDALDQAQL